MENKTSILEEITLNWKIFQCEIWVKFFIFWKETFVNHCTWDVVRIDEIKFNVGLPKISSSIHYILVPSKTPPSLKNHMKPLACRCNENFISSPHVNRHVFRIKIYWSWFLKAEWRKISIKNKYLMLH